MARHGITYHQVAKVASQLCEDGKNPTVDNVRQALGSTGSKSTIAPLLKQWKIEHQKVVVESDTGWPVELLQAMKSVYEKLQADAKQELEVTRDEHHIALQAMTDQMNALKAENSALSMSNAGLSINLQQTTDDFAALQQKQEALNLNLATLQSDHVGLQQRLLDRSTEIAALNQQLTQARIQFEHYQESITAQRAAERQAAEERLARQERDMEVARSQLMGQHATIAQQEEKISALHIEKNQLQEATRLTQDNFMSLRSERDQLAYQLKEISSTNEGLMIKLEAMHQALTESRIALAAQENKTTLLSAQLHQTEEKKEKLKEDQSTFIERLAILQAQLMQIKQKEEDSRVS